MVKRGDLVDANEFVVKVEIRLKLKKKIWLILIILVSAERYVDFNLRLPFCWKPFGCFKCLPNDKSKLDRPIG